MMNLSSYFTKEQAEFSSTAKRNGILHTMNVEQTSNAKLLAIHTLDPIYTKICKFRIESWFRGSAVNMLVGGSVNPPSQHMNAEAADIIPIKMELYTFIDKILKSKIPFDQLILEYDSWCHISYSYGKNRHQTLRATRMGGKTVYQNL
jgi:zinc D-Ala-D-Ala carboxypeptidase